jgi:tetratricopeptide (TPR) repeat protein
MFRRAVALFCLCALPGHLRAEATAGEIVKLEPFIIEAASDDPWHYLAVPGFEILSRCPDDFTVQYARALQRATAARLALLPADYWGELPTPIKAVLYNRKPESPEGLLRSNLIDLSWTSQSEAILGSKAVRISFPAMVGDGDEFISCGNYWNVRAESSGFCVDLDSAIRLRNRVPQFPSWFVAGLEGPFGLYANRFIQSTPAGDSVILPNAVWVSDAETIALQKDYQQKRKGRPVRVLPALLPLAKLFSGDIGGEQQDLWNSEAALFVRWGLYGKGNGDAENRSGFLAFVDQTTKEPPTEALFQKCFGLSYAQAEESFREFLASAVSEPIQVPFPVRDNPPYAIREATAGETARIIGDWARLEARNLGPLYYEYKHKCLDQAERLFERKYAGRNDDPLFLAAFGLYAVQMGEDGRARKALEAATDAGIVRPRAYVELGRLRLTNALPEVMHGTGDLNPAEFGDILALLETARRQMPALPSSYNVLARTLRHAPEKLTRADLAFLREAINSFPYNAALAGNVASLYREAGFPAEATAIIERAMAFSDSAAARVQLSGFSDDQTGETR